MNNEDREYFSEVYGRYADTVYRLGLVWLNNRADAEDMTADLFVKLMSRPRTGFTGEEHEKAFVIRSAINLCKDRLRRRKFRQESYDDGILRYMETPEEIGLMEEIMALPPKYRTVIYLHYCQGYTAGETAKLLGLKESTVRSQLTRGREKLKAQLNEGGFNCV